MKRIILISILAFLVFWGSIEITNKDFNELDYEMEEFKPSSSIDEFDVISTTVETKTPSPQPEQSKETLSPISDMNKGPDGEFIFTKDHEKVDIYMKENIYIDMYQDIFINTENYLGKTIRVEGMYTEYTYDDGSSYNFIYRYGPVGCPCCNGSFYGIEFTWDENLPKENDWIEVIGVLDEYTEDGLFFLTLRGVSVKILNERGKEDLS